MAACLAVGLETGGERKQTLYAMAYYIRKLAFSASRLLACLLEIVLIDDFV